MKLYIVPALFILTILALTTPNLTAQQFGAPAFYTIGTPGSMPEGVAAADFNRDGHIDLAAIDNAFWRETLALERKPEIHADRYRKLEASRQQRQVRCQSAA